MRSVIRTSLATAVTAAVGSIASRSSVDTWYRTLDKPSYVPPDVVFPVAWTTLYADIAVTTGAALDRMNGADGRRRPYTVALAANLVLNAGWSWLFFVQHRLGTATVAAAALTASSADLARRTAVVHPTAGRALLAYPLWCAFATVLSADVWRRNR